MAWKAGRRTSITAAATLETLVEFYDTRFGSGFSPQEKSDLIAFLKTL